MARSRNGVTPMRNKRIRPTRSRSSSSSYTSSLMGRDLFTADISFGSSFFGTSSSSTDTAPQDDPWEEDISGINSEPILVHGGVEVRGGKFVYQENTGPAVQVAGPAMGDFGKAEQEEPAAQAKATLNKKIAAEATAIEGNFPVERIGEMGGEGFIQETAVEKLELGVFEILPSNVPEEAIPILDEGLGAVIGYRHKYQGITTVYDIDGSEILKEEEGLKTPLISPLDLAFLGGLVVVSVRKILSVLSRATTTKALESVVANTLNNTTLSILRSRFAKYVEKPVKFSETAAGHMNNADRYVPVHILRLAIRFGKRSPDPQGVKGLYMYRVPVRFKGKPYTLEVLVREKDNMIMHFQYFR